jgi:hypothetical protein
LYSNWRFGTAGLRSDGSVLKGTIENKRDFRLGYILALLVWGSIVTGGSFMEVPPLPFDAAALAAGPIVLFWHTAGVMLIGMALYLYHYFKPVTFPFQGSHRFDLAIY